MLVNIPHMDCMGNDKGTTQHLVHDVEKCGSFSNCSSMSLHCRMRLMPLIPENFSPNRSAPKSSDHQCLSFKLLSWKACFDRCLVATCWVDWGGLPELNWFSIRHVTRMITHVMNLHHCVFMKITFSL